MVDDCYRTEVPGIYAAGDVIGPPALASVSMEQARVAACHAFGIAFKQVVDPISPDGRVLDPRSGGRRTHPQQAAAEGIDYEIGVASSRTTAARSSPARPTASSNSSSVRDDRRLSACTSSVSRRRSSCTTGRPFSTSEGTIDCFIQAVYNVPTLTETYKYAAYDGLQRLARRGAH